MALLLLGLAALVIGAPTAMWFNTWPGALGRWLPRVVGSESIARGQFRDAVVPRFLADGPPMEVRLAALGSWILGTMFVPGLMLGLFGLVAMGLGLVSIPGLILAWRLFFLGRPLLRGESEAAPKARALARFARVLNYLVLAVCGAAAALQAPELWRHGLQTGAWGTVAMALAVGLYAGVSLAHAALLERAARAIDEQEATTQAVITGLRIEVPAAAGGPPMSEGMSEGMSEESARAGRG